MAQHQNAALRREIGNRVRALREESGITSQEALAAMAGVHRTYVGRLERGESGITVETLAAILAALNVSLAEFFVQFVSVGRVRTPRHRS